jgi:hypothetical protein
MINRIRFLLFLLFTFGNLSLRADSPLTSTPFYMAYLDVPIIKAHEGAATISSDGMKFLDSNAPLDEKVAMINALGWGKETLVKEYRQFLGKKHGLNEPFFDSVLQYRGDNPEEYPGTDKLSQNELICLAYFQAMGDYFNPLKGHYCAYQAYIKGPSKTLALIYGLIVAQYNLDVNWCYVYQVMDYCLNQAGIAQDAFREEAVRIIFEYIDLYKSECVEEVVDYGEHEYGLVQPKPDYFPFEGVQENKGKKDHADLMIEEIIRPEYVDAYQGTRVMVIIKNNGPTSSFPALARLSEVDLSKAEAQRLGMKGYQLEYAGELDVRGENPDADDPYFEAWSVIPVIDGGKRYVLEFIIMGHWIYDPNAEFKVELDTENNISEPNEKNNVMYFVEGG